MYHIFYGLSQIRSFIPHSVPLPLEPVVLCLSSVYGGGSKATVPAQGLEHSLIHSAHCQVLLVWMKGVTSEGVACSQLVDKSGGGLRQARTGAGPLLDLAAASDPCSAESGC